MRYSSLLIIIIGLLVISSCGDNTTDNPPVTNLEQKIGQMIMVGYRGASLTDEFPVTLSNQIVAGKVGGILFLAYNFTDSVQTASVITHFKTLNARLPLLLALDQEGGRVQRLNSAKGFRNYPSAKAVADSLSVEDAYLMYQDMAFTLNVLGINLNLAPCIDVNVNPESPAIGALGRSYSSDPAVVVRYATSFINSHKIEKVLTCLKHFPGHGSARADSHNDITDITNTWLEYELEPYRSLINSGKAAIVMPGHLFNLNIDTAYPASLSEKFINRILRQDLRFNGIVISDDLQMGAISQHYTFEEVVILAINAGTDILLFSNYFNPDPLLPDKIIEAVKKAVHEGKIKESRIDESYSRILNLKNSLRHSITYYSY